jgi:glutamate formiminotransferase/formiminotetrahydrofolate cyclodeaminase
MKQLIECVPNFSEGRDLAIIQQITGEIERMEGVRLLDVDQGKATNRTVVTFVGEPEPIIEAAFRATSTAARLIDMSKHKGEHPRFGATDVCPLVPVSGISMDEVVIFARRLAERIGKELQIPVYCYEYAAFRKERRNLADVRAGEYEGLPEKLRDPDWKPDFGPAEFVKRTGSIAVGARDFLVAYNINLNTTSARRANAIAFDVREKGRVKRKGDPLTGEIVRDEKGNPVMVPGTLKAVKAIGWFIEEYGIAQISMNLTNLRTTPIHVAFDEVCEKAAERGIRVTGSELVGLVPLQAMLDAGRYFLKKQQRSIGVSDKELMKIAVKSLGLDDLYKFKPGEKIIEYRIAEGTEKLLKNMTLEEFVFETASESPAPGGGSVSACLGSLGAALGTMVANLSAHKKGWDDRWEEFSDWAEKGKKCQEELLSLIDKDTAAFNALLNAWSLPGSTKQEKTYRSETIEQAVKNAIMVPYRVMEVAAEAMDVVRAMAETGNPNSVSDAGVGALALRSCIKGAFLNIKINVPSLKDKHFGDEMISKGAALQKKAEKSEREILVLVESRI